MRSRHLFTSASFIVASLINPGYFMGCGSDTPASKPAFQYGAEELTALTLTANDSFDFTVSGVDYRLDVDILPANDPSQAHAGSSAFANTAYACGSRTLYAVAAACLDVSYMPVAGHFTLLRTHPGADDEFVATDVPVHGQLTVSSLVLSGGQLQLQFDHGSALLDSQDGKTLQLVSFAADTIGPKLLALNWSAR